MSAPARYDAFALRWAPASAAVAGLLALGQPGLGPGMEIIAGGVAVAHHRVARELARHGWDASRAPVATALLAAGAAGWAVTSLWTPAAGGWGAQIEDTTAVLALTLVFAGAGLVGWTERDGARHLAASGARTTVFEDAARSAGTFAAKATWIAIAVIALASAGTALAARLG